MKNSSKAGTRMIKMLLLGSLIFIPFFGEMMEFGVIVSIRLILFLGVVSVQFIKVAINSPTPIPRKKQQANEARPMAVSASVRVHSFL